MDFRFCAFLSGDSGRGRDGRALGRKAGLGARPGPTDWLDLCVEGVVLEYALISPPPRLKPLSDGDVGVGGKESADTVGEARFFARAKGRKIPAPGIDVVKYRVL